ncbi:MAG: 23S rRNA (uracil(1939)-C(5))-methyltransferase RlmD [Bacillota bacterium]
MARTRREGASALELRIEGLTHQGDGVGRHEGLAVFVPGAIPGDRVLAEVWDRRKNYVIARLVKLLDPSPDRVESPCPSFSSCGGCALLQMRYSAQLKWKKQLVIDALERIGGIRQPPVADVVPAPKVLNYRNKVVLPVVRRGNRVHIGAYARKSHEVVGSEDCLLHRPELNQLLHVLVGIIHEMDYTTYNEGTGKGIMRYALGRCAVSTGQIMAGVVTAVKKLPKASVFASRIVEALPRVTTVVQNINQEPGNIVLGEETKTILGNGYIEDELKPPGWPGLQFRISATSFYQVNPDQAAVCYGYILDFVKGCSAVLDTYCGIGTITLFLAKQAELVVGIEEVPQAVRDAKRNALLNRLDNVHFVCGMVERELPKLLGQGIRPDAIVLDPPRAGVAEQVLKAVINARPRRLCYMSCYPPTLARDLKVLLEGGYELEGVQPVDMFPQTIHVEAIAYLKGK